MTGLRQRLTEVSLRNYKSIASCDVRIGPLAIFVGPNGAGKSNFLDALRLVAEALRRSLGDVVRERGGFREIRHRGKIAARSVVVVLRLQLKARKAFYGFRIERRKNGYVVAHEACQVGTKRNSSGFLVRAGDVERGPRPAIPVDPTELYLVRMGGIEPFDEVFQHLSGMAFYNPNVDRIRELQTLDDGKLLDRDGCNLASVLRRLGTSAPKWKTAVEEYLGAMVPQIVGVEPRLLGPKITLQFLQLANANLPNAPRKQRKFLAENMSDGTLRGLAVLVAMLQAAGGDGRASLVGIEEPESALHVGALGPLTDAAIEASDHVQTLATTHSVELLDNRNLPYDCIYPVELDGGRSRIGSLDDACVAAIERGDYTVGELLSMGQASPRFPRRQRRALFPRRPGDA